VLVLPFNGAAKRAIEVRRGGLDQQNKACKDSYVLEGGV